MKLPAALLDNIACNFANLVVLSLDSTFDTYDSKPDWKDHWKFEPYSTYMEAKKTGSRFYEKRYRAFNQNSQFPKATGQSERLQTLMLTAVRYECNNRITIESTKMTVDILPPKTVGKAPVFYYTEDKGKARLRGGPPRPRLYDEVMSLFVD